MPGVIALGTPGSSWHARWGGIRHVTRTFRMTTRWLTRQLFGNSPQPGGSVGQPCLALRHCAGHQDSLHMPCGCLPCHDEMSRDQRSGVSGWVWCHAIVRFIATWQSILWASYLYLQIGTAHAYVVAEVQGKLGLLSRLLTPTAACWP